MSVIPTPHTNAATQRAEQPHTHPWRMARTGARCALYAGSALLVGALTACGGGDDDNVAANCVAPVSTSLAATGKTLYANHCASCHGGVGAIDGKARASANCGQRLLNAIAGNSGGMRFLSTSIHAAEADHIALYLVNPN
jgi:mono/diheme cytochrome c family protein